MGSMKSWKSWVAVVSLAAFVGLSAAETSHIHKSVQKESACAVCQIAHQTPALVAQSAIAATVALHSQLIVSAIPSFIFRYTTAPSGLSPPLH